MSPGTRSEPLTQRGNLSTNYQGVTLRQPLYRGTECPAISAARRSGTQARSRRAARATTLAARRFFFFNVLRRSSRAAVLAATVDGRVLNPGCHMTNWDLFVFFTHALPTLTLPSTSDYEYRPTLTLTVRPLSILYTINTNLVV